MALTNADKNALLTAWAEVNGEGGNQERIIAKLWTLVVGSQPERDIALKGALASRITTRQAAIDNFDAEASAAKADAQAALDKLRTIDDAIKPSDVAVDVLTGAVRGA